MQRTILIFIGEANEIKIKSNIFVLIWIIVRTVFSLKLNHLSPNILSYSKFITLLRILL